MRRNRIGKYKKIQKPISNILYSAIMDAVAVADRHLTDVGINIRTRKWYLNVFYMILSAAVQELGNPTLNYGVQSSKGYASTGFSHNIPRFET